MAKIQTYDPGSSEVKSPLIAGLTEAANKISDALNMTSKAYSNEPLTEVYIDEDDRYRIYQVDMGKRLWLSYPEPIIRKNGNVIRPETDYFSLDPVGGSITFDEMYRLTAFDKITADFTCVTNSSSVLTDVLNDILELKTDAAHNKGFYPTSDELILKNPTGVNGDYAIVGETDTTWVWDSDTGGWVDTHKATDLSNYYTKNETDTLLSSKEPTINPKEDTSPSNYYFSGDKQWTDILYKIRNTTLEGYSNAVEGDIETTDNIISAFSKVGNTLESKADKVSDTTGGNLAGLDETGNLIDSKLVITRIPMKDEETGLLDSDLLAGKEPWEYQSKKNLLDNWYFMNPVNQRGQTTYSSNGTSVYSIDRWKIGGVPSGNWSFTLSGGGIQLSTQTAIQQVFEKVNWDQQTVTCSILLDQTLLSATFVWNSSNGYTEIQNFENGYRLAYSGTAKYLQIYNASGTGALVLKAAKLELGDTQTLAHQEAGGNWVLSDVPPNFGEELAKCQRYQLVMPLGSKYASVNVTTNYIDFFIPTPVSMRVRPVLSVGFVVKSIDGITTYSGFTIASLGTNNPVGVLVRATKAAHGVTDAFLNASEDIILDSNL